MIKHKIRIYVDHGEAYGNLGDEAMLLNALRRLEQYLGPCEFVLPSEPNNPLPQELPAVTTVLPPHVALAKWARRFRVPFAMACRIPLVRRLLPNPNSAFLWRWATQWANFRLSLFHLGMLKSPGKTLEPFVKAIENCDAFYGVGAADFNDFWLEGVVYKSWLYTLVGRYVNVSAVSSQGIGPLETKWARRMMRQAFETVDLLSFRDHSLSRSIIASEKPAHVRYEIVGDEAFTLPPAASDKALSLLRKSELPENKSFIAVHFRTTDYTQDTAHLIPRTAKILDQIAEVMPHYFVFFPMSYHKHSRFDEECGHAIQSNMSWRARFLVAPVCRDVQVVKGAVGMAKYSLGLSYHIHVFSLSQGHPAIILYTGDYYRCKSEGLVGFYGEPNASINLIHAEDSQILDAVRKVEGHYVAACEVIRRVNEELLKHNDWTLQEMASLFGRDGELKVLDHV